MTRIAIVYHTGFGHTTVVAEAVARGAATVPDTKVSLIPVAEAQTHLSELEASDALIFGCPTYMGSVSAPFKAFMDASSKVWLARGWKDKLAAGFTQSASASGDKLATLQQLVIFAAQHGMVWVGLGLVPGWNSSQSSSDDLNRLGSYLGAMAQFHIDRSADKVPYPSDLETAAHLGKRVAEAATRWAMGQQIALAAA